MGKYSEVLAGLPLFRGDDSKQQEKVERVKAELRQDNQELVGQGSSLANSYAALRGRPESVTLLPVERVEALIAEFGKEGLEELLSIVNLRIEAISQLMVEQFDNEGISTIRLQGGVSISVQPEPYAQVTDKGAFRKWCVDNGLDGQFTLPWQTTNSIAKERLLAGEPEPAGVSVFIKNKIVRRS